LAGNYPNTIDEGKGNLRCIKKHLITTPQRVTERCGRLAELDRFFAGHGDAAQYPFDPFQRTSRCSHVPTS
jgi:hypothetical protein